MTEVTFYLLPTQTLTERLQWCCRLCAKVYHLNQRVMVYASDKEWIKTLDELLWTFEDTSFIPHAIMNAALMKSREFPAIMLSHQENLRMAAGILLNLDSQIPAWHEEYARIIEVVSQDEPSKIISRDHYRYYREKNYPITTHKMT